MPTTNSLPGELRTALTDSTPLYAVAGLGDLALTRLRETPVRLAQLRSEVPARVAELRSEVPARVAELRSHAEPKTLAGTVTERVRALQADAAHLPLRAAGLALELGARAGDTYSELAKRGRAVVQGASRPGAAATPAAEKASGARGPRRSAAKPARAASKPATSRRRAAASKPAASASKPQA